MRLFSIDWSSARRLVPLALITLALAGCRGDIGNLFDFY